MAKFKIPGVSFSLNRALGITQAKQKFARETGIPTSKAGLERKKLFCTSAGKKFEQLTKLSEICTLN